MVDREDRVEVRRITAKRRVETDWVVSDGLATGERVIIEVIQTVPPTMVAKPVKAS